MFLNSVKKWAAGALAVPLSLLIGAGAVALSPGTAMAATYTTSTVETASGLAAALFGQDWAGSGVTASDGVVTVSANSTATLAAGENDIAVFVQDDLELVLNNNTALTTTNQIIIAGSGTLTISGKGAITSSYDSSNAGFGGSLRVGTTGAEGAGSSPTAGHVVLNGGTIENDKAGIAVELTNGTLEVNNGATVTQSNSNTETTNGPGAIQVGVDGKDLDATCTINNGATVQSTTTGNAAGNGVLVCGVGELIVNGGTITAAGQSAIAALVGKTGTEATATGTPTVTVNGGTITGQQSGIWAGVPGGDSAVTAADAEATITVTGGEITGKTVAGITTNVEGGALTVEGGEITGPEGGNAIASQCDKSTLSGGEINGGVSGAEVPAGTTLSSLVGSDCLGATVESITYNASDKTYTYDDSPATGDNSINVTPNGWSQINTGFAKVAKDANAAINAIATNLGVAWPDSPNPAPEGTTGGIQDSSANTMWMAFYGPSNVASNLSVTFTLAGADNSSDVVYSENAKTGAKGLGLIYFGFGINNTNNAYNSNNPKLAAGSYSAILGKVAQVGPSGPAPSGRNVLATGEASLAGVTYVYATGSVSSATTVTNLVDAEGESVEVPVLATPSDVAGSAVVSPTGFAFAGWYQAPAEGNSYTAITTDALTIGSSDAVTLVAAYVPIAAAAKMTVSPEAASVIVGNSATYTITVPAYEGTDKPKLAGNPASATMSPAPDATAAVISALNADLSAVTPAAGSTPAHLTNISVNDGAATASYTPNAAGGEEGVTASFELIGAKKTSQAQAIDIDLPSLGISNLKNTQPLTGPVINVYDPLTVYIVGNGTVDQAVAAGGGYVLTATPADGATFEGWQQNGAIISTTNPFEVPANFGAVTAVFTSSDTPTPPTPEGQVPIYRMRNILTNEHLYTPQMTEVNALLAGDWTYEGVKWNAPTEGDAVYRLFNRVNGEHLYTNDLNEKDVLLASGQWEADFYGEPAFYAFDEPTEGATAVTRLFNSAEPPQGSHLWTMDVNEVYVLTTERGWTDEGVKFYEYSVLP